MVEKNSLGNLETKNNDSDSNELNNDKTLASGSVIKRRVAMIVPSAFILMGEYKKQDGWNPNYVEYNNLKIIRVNMIGVVVDKNEGMGYPYIVIDDGFATIQVRNFENWSMFGDVDVGDLVLIIGKPREFNGNKYILCEIIKKMENQKWLEYRTKLFEREYKEELSRFDKEEYIANKNNEEEAGSKPSDFSEDEIDGSVSSEKMEKKENQPEEISISEESFDEQGKEEAGDEINGEKESENLEEIKEDSKTQELDETDKSKEKENKRPPSEIVFKAIRELDDGEGASIEEIVKIVDVEHVESVIEKLIKEGEIFRSSPGKVKIL